MFAISFGYHSPISGSEDVKGDIGKIIYNCVLVGGIGIDETARLNEFGISCGSTCV